MEEGRWTIYNKNFILELHDTYDTRRKVKLFMEFKTFTQTANIIISQGNFDLWETSPVVP